MARHLTVFLGVALFDLYLLLVVGQWVGALPTIALVLATAVVGGVLAKAEGLRVLRGWQEALAAGRVPEEGILDGVLVLVGGVLLILPGILADLAGLALLTPPIRRAIAGFARGRLAEAVQRGNVQVVSFANGTPSRERGQELLGAFVERAARREMNDVLDVVGEVVEGDGDGGSQAGASPKRDIPRLGP